MINILRQAFLANVSASAGTKETIHYPAPSNLAPSNLAPSNAAPSNAAAGNLNTPRANRPDNQFRRGYTLVEILVVIGIIAILAGITIPAAISITRASYEVRIRRQLQQIGDGIESFHAQFGIFPPDNYYNWEPGQLYGPRWLDPELPNLEGLLIQRYGEVLQKISPNHMEFDRSPRNLINGETRIVAWYKWRGQYLNPSNALSFWLMGGLNKDAEFPLSYEMKSDFETDEAYVKRMENSQNHVICDVGNFTGDYFDYWALVIPRKGPIPDPSWIDIHPTTGAPSYNQNVPLVLRTACQVGTETPILYFVDGTNTERDEDGYINSAYIPFQYSGLGAGATMNPQGLVSRGKGDIKVIGDAPGFTPVYNFTPDQSLLGYKQTGYLGAGKYQLRAAGADGVLGDQSVNDPSKGIGDDLCSFSGYGRGDSADPFDN